MSDSPIPKHSPIDFQALLTEFDASGESAAAFARARDIPRWRMYHELSRRTKARRRVGARAEEPALLPVRVVEDATSGSAPLELILAGGYRLRIGGDFDAMLLRKLLEVLAPC